MSVWGAMVHLTLFFALAVVFLGLTENRTRWLRTSLVVSVFIASMSVIMATIATFALGTFCINCMASYVMSFVLLFHDQVPGRALLENFKS
ncbi:MAG: vitamin K epoxide reductase family protein [Bdellovibrionales bacterium]